jgi:hypothetical protein
LHAEHLSLHPSAGQEWHVFLLAASAWAALRGAGAHPASARSPAALPSSPRTHSEQFTKPSYLPGANEASAGEE